VAYRTLSQAERTRAVHYYVSQQKTKKPKLGTKVTIITIIGYDE
jgi:hypothetical protein